MIQRRAHHPLTGICPGRRHRCPSRRREGWITRNISPLGPPSSPAALLCHHACPGGRCRLRPPGHSPPGPGGGNDGAEASGSNRSPRRWDHVPASPRLWHGVPLREPTWLLWRLHCLRCKLCSRMLAGHVVSRCKWRLSDTSKRGFRMRCPPGMSREDPQPARRAPPSDAINLGWGVAAKGRFRRQAEKRAGGLATNCARSTCDKLMTVAEEGGWLDDTEGPWPGA
jgi:hypothetical protein